MGDNSKNGGGWLGAKKLWSSITTEVSQIFTEPTATTKADESRIGQTGGRSLMAEFDQQLSKELGDSSRPSFSPTASFPSPHYGQPSSSSPSPYSQPNGSAWNPHEASDMGLAPTLPAYQQQLMQHVPSTQPLTDPLGSQYPQASPYPTPTQPSLYPPPQSQTAPVSNGHPYYPSSPPTSSPYSATGPSPYPTSPYPGSGASPYPSSPYPMNAANPPTQPLPQPPHSPSRPFPSPPYAGPAPVSPSPYSNAAPYLSGASPYPAPTSSPYPTNPPYASPAPSANPPLSTYPSPSPAYPTPPPASSLPPPNSAYLSGPSFTSAAYSSSPSPSLPLPPPSNYWVTRAQQAPAQPSSRLGLGLDHVDYSDLDPRSMDFAYAQKNKQSGQQT